MIEATSTTRPRPPGRFERRGSAYVLFLASALLVTLIGMSAIAVVRIRLQATEATRDSAATRIYVQSAIETALRSIYTDPNWRDTIAHDTWTSSIDFGDGSFTWKLVDEASSSFTRDRNAPVRAYGRAVQGDAVWVYSVLVQPPLEEVPTTGPNLLVNGNFEKGIDGWIGSQSDIASDATDPYEGAAALLVSNRANTGAGPTQDVMRLINNGASFNVEAWVYLPDSPDTVNLTLYIGTKDTGFSFPISQASASGVWTQVGGQITPTWTGEPTLAQLAVNTTSTTQNILIDDVSIKISSAPSAVTIGPIAGTWRREPR